MYIGKYRAQVIHKALWVGITMSTSIDSKNSFVFFFQHNPQSKYIIQYKRYYPNTIELKSSSSSLYKQVKFKV